MFLALIKKEWLLATRQKHIFLSLFFFSTLVIMLIYFGLGGQGPDANAAAPSVLWLTIVFGGTLQLNRTFDFERDEDVMDSMSLIKGIATPFYLSKFATNVIILFFIAIFAALIVSTIFDRSITVFAWRTIAPISLGIIGLSAAGTTFSTMVMRHHKRDILLPTIFYPLIAPLAIAVMKSFTVTGDSLPWIKLLIAFDIIYVVASVLVFDKMMEG